MKFFSAILMKLISIFILLIIFLFTDNFALAQQKYWVFFNDKQGVDYNPYTYLDVKAIDRRKNCGVSLFDISDFPVNNKYLAIISKIADSVLYETRWFNGTSVYTSPDSVKIISRLPFVLQVEPISLHPMPAVFKPHYSKDFEHTCFDSSHVYNDRLDSSHLQLLLMQTKSMKGDSFILNGFNGKGIRIAIFDGGFPSVDINPAFAHIRKDRRILKTWNFPDRKENVYEDNRHGTMVFSCIAGIINGRNIGLACGAEFLLARTEISREVFSEEENWLAAIEWADKNGADIINSSLGYTSKRYFPEQMDGRTSLASRAAARAATKGILVVNAAGNDGMNAWKKIASPADADSILTVGGIDPKTGYHINFSSYGPTSDLRMKPNVSAYASVIAAGTKKLQMVDGTSFASPLVAGFAACAWQTDRNLTNFLLLKKIEQSADLYPYFDYAHGFGVPQADFFTNLSKNKNTISNLPTFEIIKNNENIDVIIKDDFLKSKDGNNLLYYNIQNPEGVLKKYFVIKVYDRKALTIDISKLKKGEVINIHFRHYSASFTI